MQNLLSQRKYLVSVLIVSLIGLVILLNQASFETAPYLLDTGGDLKLSVSKNKIEAFREGNNYKYKVWETESDIEKIDTAFIYDIDKDQAPELITLVWTRKDFFADRDYLSPIRGNLPSQHIRIYNLSPSPSIKWGGSTMRTPLVEFGLCGNTIKFLCGFESSYDSYPEKYDKVALSWDGWSLGIHPFPAYEKMPSIFIAGETMLARDVERAIVGDKKTYLFDSFKQYLSESSLSIVSIENTFVADPIDCNSSCLNLQANLSLVPMLKEAGFDMVALASNHQGDAGQEGYLSTLKAFENSGVQTTGIIKGDELIVPVVSQVGSIKVGLISADDVKPDYWANSSNQLGVYHFSKTDGNTKQIDKQKVASLKDVKKKNKIDFLIVHLSWGNEYQEEPDEYQEELAHLLIDAGVDFIVGSHPHITQQHEVYRGKYIFYSLGNFIFDQTDEEFTRQGIALRLTINEDISQFPESYLADIDIIHHHSCGPKQSNINFAEAYLSETISLETLAKNFDNACVYYMPIIRN